MALAYAADVSTTDLINAGQASLASATSTDSFNPGGSSFQPENLNDGDYLTGSGDVTFYDSSRLPATVVFDLDVSTFTLGYDISSVRSFMGWSGVNRIQCHQVYTIEVSFVGSSAYTPVASVNYTPFPNAGFSDQYESQVTTIEDGGGVLAGGVDSIRFVFSDAVGSNGVVIRELDVLGFPTGTAAGTVTAATPTPRQIVQRSAAGVADISISGSYADTVDAIQARVVVRSEAGNSGTTTAWQTISTAPTGGVFSGTLTAVPEGGWYDLELRSLTGGIPSNVTFIERVGVGDIYLVAGQSNSVNFGSDPLDPNDDRVSARTLPTGNAWVRTVDPLPSFDPSRAGSGGSAWTRLGPLLTASEDVPIGFVSLGIGNTHVNEWLSPNLFYNTRIKAAVQSFPTNGFKAILWHQGERDSNINTAFADYQSRLTSVITQSRIDAAWDIPWYVAEAAYQSGTSLIREEPIKAAQRATGFDTPLVFLGASTDEFHIENANGGKLSDGVHFNDTGLTDHAMQWFTILTDSATTDLENSGFEKNTDPAFTTKSALAENAEALTDITINFGSNSSPSVIDWRILSANGQAAADGDNGYFNPGTATYGTADPANLEGTHAAFLSDGSAENHFLQHTRSLAVAGESYTLTVALGLRSAGTDTFGGARMEILSGGTSLRAIGQRRCVPEKI